MVCPCSLLAFDHEIHHPSLYFSIYFLQIDQPATGFTRHARYLAIRSLEMGPMVGPMSAYAAFGLTALPSWREPDRDLTLRTDFRVVTVMEDDYYSIDSILSENQVPIISSPRRVCMCTLPYSHRKYNVPSRSISLTWAISMVAASATYAFLQNISLLTHHTQTLCV
jgi:hypothetical protein